MTVAPQERGRHRRPRFAFLQRFRAHPPRTGVAGCFDRHCMACGRDTARRYAVACAECWHGWRWGWLLSLADARASMTFLHPTADGWGARRPWPRIRLRRPRDVWVCPCCAHDL